MDLAMRVALLTALMAAAVARAEPVDEDVDPIALAELMLADGRYDRAARVLDDVDPEALEPAERFDYHRIYGMVFLESGDYRGSMEQFEAAAAADPEQLVAWIFVAHAAFAMGDHARVLDALAQAGDERLVLASTAILEARSCIALERHEEALAVLVAAEQRFPDEPTMLREQALLYLQLQLYQSALDLGTRYLDRTRDDPYAWLTIGAALRDAGQLEEAAAVLEEGVLLFPEHEEMLVHLAHTYRAMGADLAAARLFERAWVQTGEYALETGEQFRLAGRTAEALRMNALIPDRTQQLRQRMAILLDAQRFEEVAALEPRLERLGMLEDDAYRYSLAYAYYRVGAFDDAERLLLEIQSSDFFEDAMYLRESIQGCREKPWWCE